MNQPFIRGEVSAVEIVSKSIEKIGQKDREIKAFLRLFPERAMEKAEQLDRKRKEGKKLGKLAGVTIAVKDNIHVKGEISTCGSRFLENYRAPFDATVVRLIEQEDAIVIGKTNLDEFAMGSSTENSAYQLTRNPHDLERTPGGSSGGSAAAVTAGFCPLTLGSDTGGSIRQPASFCGIVGFKPTYGRVSRSGLVAFASSLDQIGPFANTVADAASLMEVIGRHCEFDSTSLNLPAGKYPLGGLIAGWKIGVPRSFLEGLNPDVRKVFDESLKNFESQGATCVDVDLDLLKYSIATYYILATAEASTNLARFDGIRYGLRSKRATTLDEIYDFSKQEGFGPEVKKRILLGTYVLSAGYQDAYYKKAQKVRTRIIEQFKAAFQKCQIIAMPTTPSTAFRLGEIQDPVQMYLQDIYTICANLAGLPAISVPCGKGQDGMPLGLQLLGPQMHDPHVFQCAHAFEVNR